MRRALDTDLELGRWEQKLQQHREAIANAEPSSAEKLKLLREVRTIEQHLDRLQQLRGE